MCNWTLRERRCNCRRGLIKVRQFSYGVYDVEYAERKTLVERVFRISHINRSVERRRESILWTTREFLLKRAR